MLTSRILKGIHSLIIYPGTNFLNQTLRRTRSNLGQSITSSSTTAWISNQLLGHICCSPSKHVEQRTRGIVKAMVVNIHGLGYLPIKHFTKVFSGRICTMTPYNSSRNVTNAKNLRTSSINHPMSW